MTEIERIDPGKVIFVPNGIPGRPAGDGRIGERLGIDVDGPVIGTVCVLRPQKALTVLIDAAALLVERHPGLKVVIVGHGPQQPELERRIAELGLERTVVLAGHRDDVPDLIRGFDVAVCSSDFEGTPLSVLEYMQTGCRSSRPGSAGSPTSSRTAGRVSSSSRATPPASPPPSSGCSAIPGSRPGWARARASASTPSSTST